MRVRSVVINMRCTVQKLVPSHKLNRRVHDLMRARPAYAAQKESIPRGCDCLFCLIAKATGTFSTASMRTTLQLLALVAALGFAGATFMKPMRGWMTWERYTCETDCTKFPETYV
jgi:hypothetical protein